MPQQRHRRIAMIAPNGSRVGGAESYLLDLAKSLAAGGNSVTLIHRAPDHDPVAGVSFVYVPRYDDPAEALADAAPDIVHVHDDALGPSEGTSVMSGTPVVRSLHNWWFGCSTGTLLRRGGRACPRAHGPGCLSHIASSSCTERPNPLPAFSRWRQLGSERQAVRQSAAVIVYSDYARRVALRNGVTASRCHVMRYYVDAPNVATAPPGLGQVCVVGRLTKLKGIESLLDTVSLSKCVRKLQVVGDGYYRQQLMRRTEQLGIGDRVEFLGWQGAETTREAMQNSDVVAVPSAWPEPFGIVGLEAMAVARAVVGADTGGIPEWLEDGVTGRLVPPGDPAAWAGALDSVLGDPERLTRWGLAGAERARAFSRERHLEELEEIYDAITTPAG
ncbi:MAG: glycosyltransferase family 4 protein [Actinomycetota bacterium]|nr:glycosyltransferase family 4 protein [Actinomycetota bacterium]